jgi:hypothetical protein
MEKPFWRKGPLGLFQGNEEFPKEKNPPPTIGESFFKTSKI